MRRGSTGFINRTTFIIRSACVKYFSAVILFGTRTICGTCGGVLVTSDDPSCIITASVIQNFALRKLSRHVTRQLWHL